MYVPIYISLLTKHLVRGLHASCCTLVSVSAECCGYLCYPSAVMRQWPLWSIPVPLSLIRCTCVVPLFLRCCVICHMVLIAQCGKVLWLPLRSYHLCNWISCQNLSLVSSVVGRHLGSPRCTVIGTQCVWRLILRDLGYRSSLYGVKVLWCKVYVIEGLVFTRNN